MLESIEVSGLGGVGGFVHKNKCKKACFPRPDFHCEVETWLLFTGDQ